MSCETCRRILGFGARHAAGLCPVAKSLYCGGCASYGHSPSRCPRINVCDSGPEEPLEDTDYPVEVPVEDIEKSYEIADDEECIKSALIVNGGTPMICQEKGKRELREYRENKQRLIELVKARGYTLVLRSCETTPDENIVVKSKR